LIGRSSGAEAQRRRGAGIRGAFGVLVSAVGTSLALSAQTPGPLVLTDVTREAGLSFVHQNGAAGRKFLPETMGSGSAFLDYDNDGDQDLLFVRLGA
jgi:hypothetical protein